MKPQRPSTIVSILAASTACLASTHAALFSDDFNTDSSANYTVATSSADAAAQFAFDYSAMGIPAAPNTTDASTIGLRLSANNAAPNSVEGITLHTTMQFTGSYSVTFDTWVNANGPFPGGGSGSTEFLIAGVGGDGSSVNLGGTSGSGGWFATSGEGGSSRDYRAYKGLSEQFAESSQFAAGTASAPSGGNHNNSDTYYSMFGGIDVGALPQNSSYAQQTGISSVGSFGFEWHEVSIIVDASGANPTMTWSFDGLRIGTLDAGIGAFDTDGSAMIAYADFFSSLSDNADLSFGLIDNLSVSQIPEPSGGALLLFGLSGLLLKRRRA